MSTFSMKSMLEDIQETTNKLIEILSKIEAGELSAKDSLRIESAFILGAFYIRMQTNLIQKFTTDFVDNIK